MSRDDGFLSRWSRRKQDAARAASVVPGPAAPAPADIVAARAAEEARAAQAKADAEARAAAEAREREEVLARLPKLEDLRVDSDFSGFMHPLVPAPLRSAALARLWILDPAIRTYEDPARDYAWNWNVPGGAPGGGPPPTAEEVQSTLKSLFKRFETEERVADLSAPAGDASAEEASAGTFETPGPTAADAETGGEPAETVAPSSAADLMSGAQTPPSPVAIAERRDGAAVENAAVRERAPAEPIWNDGPDPAAPAREAPRRRHGGAIPV
jgi:hypothetical protein